MSRNERIARAIQTLVLIESAVAARMGHDSANVLKYNDNAQFRVDVDNVVRLYAATEARYGTLD